MEVAFLTFSFDVYVSGIFDAVSTRVEPVTLHGLAPVQKDWPNKEAQN